MIKKSKTPLFDLVPIALRPALKKEIEGILEEEKRTRQGNNATIDANKNNTQSWSRKKDSN